MRLIARLLFSMALALPAAAAPAETILIAVSETVDGVPTPNPPPATEGIYDGLFASGHIVFDLGDGRAVPPIDDLADMARTGGAGYVLEAVIQFTTTPGAEGKTEISATARFSLMSAGSVKRLGAGTVTDTNHGRERDVDLAGLGFELGGMIVKKVNGIISAGGG